MLAETIVAISALLVGATVVSFLFIQWGRYAWPFRAPPKARTKGGKPIKVKVVLPKEKPTLPRRLHDRYPSIYNFLWTLYLGTPFRPEPDIIPLESPEEDRILEEKWRVWRAEHVIQGKESLLDHLSTVIDRRPGESDRVYRERLRTTRATWKPGLAERVIRYATQPDARPRPGGSPSPSIDQTLAASLPPLPGKRLPASTPSGRRRRRRRVEQAA